MLYLYFNIKGNILQIESYAVTPKFKKFVSYLTHLKLGSLVYFVEIDLSNTLSNSSLNKYSNTLNKRMENRISVKKEEDCYEKIIKREKEKETIRKENEYLSYQSSFFDISSTKFYNKINEEDLINLNSNSLEANSNINTNTDSDINNNANSSAEANTNIINKEKKSKKINCLLEGKTVDEIYEEERKVIETKMKIEKLNNRDEFPDLEDTESSKNTTNNLENVKKTSKLNKNNNDGGKKKKKKFIDL